MPRTYTTDFYDSGETKTEILLPRNINNSEAGISQREKKCCKNILGTHCDSQIALFVTNNDEPFCLLSVSNNCFILIRNNEKKSFFAILFKRSNLLHIQIYCHEIVICFFFLKNNNILYFFFSVCLFKVIENILITLT